MIRHFFFFPMFFLFLIGCGSAPDASKPNTGGHVPVTYEDIAENNRGVGLMGSFKYLEAHEVFQKLSERHPTWLPVKVNLAIATLNLQTEGSEDRALRILMAVLKANPDHLPANYCAGLLYLYKGDTKAALSHFQMVVEKDPEDPHAAYYLGQCHAREGDYATAAQWYRRARDRDPYLRSAYYGLFQAEQRLGNSDAARSVLMEFQKLDGNPRAHQAEFKYTRMGPKAEASTVNLVDETASDPPEGPLFLDPIPLAVLPPNTSWLPPRAATAITPCDIDGDGSLDLFLPDAFSVGGAARNGIFVAGPNGFRLVADHPLAGVQGVQAALWGDMDNDGSPEVYFCKKGPNQLFRRDESGGWVDITDVAGVKAGDRDTVDGLWLDADHDGDLDLFLVNADGPNELLNNNLDGTFRAIAADQGIAGDGRPSRSVLATDLDKDRDVDIIVLKEKPPHEVYLNDRLWQYKPADGFQKLVETPLVSLLAGDDDAHGRVILYGITDEGLFQKWSRASDGTWAPSPLGTVAPGTLARIDINGSGRLQWLHRNEAGWSVSTVWDGVLKDLWRIEDHAVSRTPIVLGEGDGPSVAAVLADGRPILHRPGPGRHAYLSFSFTGREDKGNAMRSNALGIGTRFMVRIGSRWIGADTFRAHTGPGQGLQPVAIGMGGDAHADFVAINWSDGVFQTELGLETGKHYLIEETQRQLSSCPVLFAWDGEKYAFISDLLGVGGIGFAVTPGVYSTPRPWENFLLPAEKIQVRDGRFSIKIAEPMEEACYLDSVQLSAWSLPRGWSMTLDERMAVNGAQPTGRPFFFRETLLPVFAQNDRGEEVTDTVVLSDGQAAPVPGLDRRFIGLLSQDHVLILTFANPLDKGEPVLVIDGWVEYPYSQTSFAAWQAGLSYNPLTVEARAPDGSWVTVLSRFGYPAGMPRQMSVPLGNLPAGTRELRFRTNQEIYLDRVAVVFSEPCPEAKKTVLPLRDARLEAVGFAKRTTGPQRQPHYDDENRAPLWDTRHQSGFYTELGDVTPLVSKTDDAVAVFGPGEAVILDFNASALNGSPVHYFLLESAGWCKDMDLYTKSGETIEPLPTTGKPADVRDRLHDRFNTRYRSGY